MMKRLKLLLIAACVAACELVAQDTFTVTGTAIPTDLLKMNYGNLPKGIDAYDLAICNSTEIKHSLTSSQIYQALIEARVDLRPIGRQIMLAAILRNQNRSLRTWLSLGLGSTTSVLSVLGNGRIAGSAGTLSLVALGALVGQQLLTTWNPVLTSDQVEKFEAQALESALIMDGGSCVERTIFTVSAAPTPKRALNSNLTNLEFHVR